MSKKSIKTTNKSTKIVPDNDAGMYIKNTALWGICLLLFLAPFFRGLFFPEDQQKALFFVTLFLGLVLLRKWIRREFIIFSHPLDYFMLAFPLLHIISSFNAVNYSLSIDELVKVTLYFIVYWCVVELVKNPSDSSKLLIVIYLSGVGVALAGLMTATGIINIKDGIQSGRMASSLQYPNALASYLAVILMVGTYLWWKHLQYVYCGEEQNKKIKVNKFLILFIAIANYFLTVVILGTKSSGGIIVFTLAMLIILIFAPGYHRIILFSHLMIATVVAAPVAYMFINNISKNNYVQAWLWILVGITMVASAHLLYKWLVPWMISIQKRPRNRALNIGIALLMLILAIFLLYINAAELKTQLLKISSITHRAYFIGDAVEMIKERPIFGWGGGGWQEAYKYYQDYAYDSNQVHSYYFQVGVETGITGIIIIIATWMVFISTAIRAYRKKLDIESKVYILIISVGAIIFGVHALIDFDLSLSALSLILYSLFALIRNIDKCDIVKEKNILEKWHTKSSLILVALCGLVIVVYTSFLMLGHAYAKDAMIYLEKGNVKEAIILLQNATKYDPHRITYYIMLAELYYAVGQRERAMDEIKTAMNISKYNWMIRLSASRMALGNKDYDSSINYAEDAIKLAPWSIVCYEYAGLAYKNGGLEELKNNNIEKAEKYLNEITILMDTIKNKKDKQDSAFMRQYSYNFDLTPKLYLYLGISNYLKGNIDEADKYIRISINEKDVRGEGLVWLSLILEKQGDPDIAKKFLKEAKEISVAYEEKYAEAKGIPQLQKKN